LHLCSDPDRDRYTHKRALRANRTDPKRETTEREREREIVSE